MDEIGKLVQKSVMKKLNSKDRILYLENRNRKTKEKRSLVKSFNHLKINKNGKSIN